MFRQQPNQLQYFVRQMLANVPRYYATKTTKNKTANKDDEVVFTPELGASFFAKNIGSTYWKWHAILSKHPELKTLKSKDVVNTINALRKFNFSTEDILTKPMILYTNEMTLENRYSVFKECGFETITISLLSKYVAAMNRSVATLKSLGHIPYKVDVIEQLRQTFEDIDVELHTNYSYNESLELKILRQRILNNYLQQRLHMSMEEVEKVWRVYTRLKHKSFYSVQKMVKVLLDELKFPRERIAKNAFLLYGDADNVCRIIKEIPTIDGQDIKEILFKRPKIMMSSCDALMATLQHVKDFGIGEEAILRCLEVLTLGPDTVLERLKDLNEVEEFQVLNTNPRILRLVHYQNKARLRLDYLNQLKVRCASLHILSCGSVAFAKFARDGSDRTKGRDIVIYLAKIMEKSEQDVRNLLSRHPNWCHIPALQVKQCYEFLLSKKFTKTDIYNNIHLLLYPTKRIDEKLLQLQTPEFLQDLQIHRSLKQLSNNEILTLVLYLIESEFHFTGDGIWTEQHTQHVENFNNLLPDFPESVNKIYKYGVKPAATTATATTTALGSATNTEYVVNH
ncbi:transcription termination factor 5, mitochondrial [Lucilia cuprina]|uniref:transcription termination factor 5, mitochondrial n=1 Tax=Lucilia cuprina TaxID=7375 RepID=UPI001F0671A3|nr:transcription termination factor 5, mitochondrial [Lucilia cuprina]